MSKLSSQQTAASNIFDIGASKPRCTCKKSKCLKLYCECFANGRVCGVECGCLECSNKQEHHDDGIIE